MARKLDRTREPASAPQGADAAEARELEILYPERMLSVGGREVTVREIGFAESLRLHAHVAPIVAAIDQLMHERNEAPGYSHMLGVFGAHWQSTLVLIGAATGLDADELQALGGAEGDTLLLTFWGVNASFFIGRAMNELAIRRETQRLLAGHDSTPPSSRTDTDPRTSDATPPAS